MRKKGTLVLTTVSVTVGVMAGEATSLDDPMITVPSSATTGFTRVTKRSVICSQPVYATAKFNALKR